MASSVHKVDAAHQHAVADASLASWGQSVARSRSFADAPAYLRACFRDWRLFRVGRCSTQPVVSTHPHAGHRVVTHRRSVFE
jgi:hypothetical protein